MRFATLRDTLSVSDSLLSKQMSTRGGHDYKRLRRVTHNGRQRVWVSLTRSGRRAFAVRMALVIVVRTRVAEASRY